MGADLSSFGEAMTSNKAKPTQQWRRRRWSAEMLDYPALSIRQPWAWLVATGQKDIENRTWRTNHRGRILIHAGLNKSGWKPALLAELAKDISLPNELQFGGIIGVATISACEETSVSPWYIEGSFAWTLSEAALLPFVPCKGALGLFKPDLGLP